MACDIGYRTVKTNQRDKVYQHIRQKMVQGAFSPGDRLFPEVLAKEVGVSHIPVREAISQLQSEGVVDRRSNGGVFIKVIERHELADLVEFRTILECAAASRAARRITAAEIQELDQRWQELCRLAEVLSSPRGDNFLDLLQDWYLADLAFHMILLRAAGNSWVIRAMEDAQVLLRMFGHRAASPAAWDDPAAHAAENLQAHRGIYEAVRRRDAKGAQRAMRLHMKQTAKNLLGWFDWCARQRSMERIQAEDFPEAMEEAVGNAGRSERTRANPQRPERRKKPQDR